MIFGVDPKSREIRGQEVSDRTLEEVASEIAEIEPAVQPLVDRVSIDGRTQAVVVQVGRGHLGPYSYRGQAYRRAGTTTADMERGEYNRVLRERLHSSVRWETEAAAGWTPDDLDAAELVRTFDEAVRRGRADEIGTRAPAELLRAFGLTRSEALLRAAVVLFARSERLLPDYPQCLLKVARFRGTDKTEFLDNRQFFGNAFDLLLRADRFLRDHLPIAGRIVPNLFERVDDPIYPTVALREALANAFCHRDYASPGAAVSVSVFDDRLEIASPGWLPFGLKPADLFRPHESHPWNPHVADVFFRRGVIEKLGRGTTKMAELTEKAGLPRPEIEEVPPASVLVRFRPSRYVAPQRIRHDLTEVQKRTLDALGAERGLALRELVVRLGVEGAERALRDDLAFLKRLGLVDSAGHGRGAKWFLKGEAPPESDG